MTCSQINSSAARRLLGPRHLPASFGARAFIQMAGHPLPPACQQSSPHGARQAGIYPLGRGNGPSFLLDTRGVSASRAFS